MGAVHQALGSDASQHPGQFQDFRDVGLGVENDILDIQPQRQPSGGDFEPRAVNQGRIMAFDQGMIIGQKIERPHVFTAACFNSGQDSADVVAQMRRTGRGDAGEGDFHDENSALSWNQEKNSVRIRWRTPFTRGMRLRIPLAKSTTRMISP